MVDMTISQRWPEKQDSAWDGTLGLLHAEGGALS